MSKKIDEMLNPKQLDFILNEDSRINLLSGAVRSGKTYISLLKWAIFVGSMPSNAEFLMTGKTITALKRNCLGLLQELVGKNNFTYSTSQKSGLLFGRQIWLEGANDERAESKIRGMTLAGAYVDELTQIPFEFYTMLLSRLSYKGAKLYATTNPDAPTHWVKTEIIDNENLDKKTWNFQFDDNVILKEEINMEAMLTSPSGKVVVIIFGPEYILSAKQNIKVTLSFTLSSTQEIEVPGDFDINNNELLQKEALAQIYTPVDALQDACLEDKWEIDDTCVI